MTSHSTKGTGSPSRDTLSADNVSTLSQANSDTSMPISESVGSDKYTRLATEYAKIRTKLNILKKAYLEEQSKVNELEKRLKFSDQNTRKHEQEIESLLFRNQQLSKRITVLQAELDANAKHSATSIFSPSSLTRRQSNSHSDHQLAALDPEVQALFHELNAELKSKTEERECLADLVKSLEASRESQTVQHEQSLASVEAEAEEAVSRLTNELRKISTMLEESNRERQRLETELGNTREQLESTTRLLEALRGENQQLKDKLTQHERVLKLGQASNWTQMVKTSLEPVQRLTEEDPRRGKLDVLANKVVVFVCALSTLHSNLAQKVSILAASFDAKDCEASVYFLDEDNLESAHKSVKVGKLLSKLGELTRVYSNHLGPIENACRTWINVANGSKTNVEEIVDMFTEYVNYLNSLNASLTLCLNTWSRTLLEYSKHVESNQTPVEHANRSKRRQLAERNESLAHCVAASVRLLSDVANFSQLLRGKMLLNSNVMLVIDRILNKMTTLHSCLEEMKRIFSLKIVLEHDLGLTCSEELRSLDDGILASLIYLCKCAGDVTLAWREHAGAFAPEDDHANKAIDSMEHHFGGHEDWVAPSQLSDDQKNTIEPQIDLEKEKLEDPEPIEDHVPKSTNNPVKTEAIKTLQTPQAASLHKSNSTAASLSSESVEANFVELGSLSSPTVTTIDNLIVAPEGAEQVDLLQAKLDNNTNTTIAKLVNSLQLADGRAAAYQRECESLQQRLRLIMDQRERAEKKLAEAETSQENRKDEYHTSVANYETQLGTMSDHLASLNEKLAAQQEEIEILNYERRLGTETMDAGGPAGPRWNNQANGSNALGTNTVAITAKSLGKKLSFKRT